MREERRTGPVGTRNARGHPAGHTGKHVPGYRNIGARLQVEKVLQHSRIPVGVKQFDKSLRKYNYSRNPSNIALSKIVLSKIN